jgi:predicted AlkP superfamily phosphohydrolase/phosphomutase
MLDAVLTGRLPGHGEGGNSLWRLRAALPTGLRASVARMLPDGVALELTARLDLRGVDWSETRAFAVPNDHHGFIRLNLAGREREGIVGPGEVDELVAEIAAGLSTFRDPDGTASVAAVERTADVIEPGDRSGQLPDLVVRFAEAPANLLDRVVSPRFGEVVRQGAGSGREGNHTDEAWALIAPGASRLRTTDRDPRVSDLGATAAALLAGDTSGLAGQPLLEPA